MKPPNETGALLHAPIPKLAVSHYHAACVPQACFPSWQREAARMFREYWRTGNETHLRAFVRQVIAMRAHEARAKQ